MALLRHVRQGETVRPASHCLVGRAPSCHLILDDVDVSREHAVIGFDGCRWHVRDLGSRNGTKVDGEPVKEFATLEQGAVLRFGSERNEWRVEDAGPPHARAVARDGRIAVADSTGFRLPAPENGHAYLSNQDGQWLLELDGQVNAVRDREELTIGADSWMLELPIGEQRVLAPTNVLGAPVAQLDFKVSADEECVELAIQSGGRTHVALHRSHSYVLLLLARERLRDQELGYAQPSEHGWIETRELARMLSTTSEQVNVWIWRAREQFSKIDSALAQCLVERRPTLGQLRIGIGSLSIAPL